MSWKYTNTHQGQEGLQRRKNDIWKEISEKTENTITFCHQRKEKIQMILLETQL